MAFTEDEKVLIRQYLGYSELFRDINPRLEGYISQLSSRSANGEARVRTILTALQAVDAQIDAMVTSGELTLKVAEDGVTFAGQDKLDTLRDAGRGYVKRLSVIMETEPRADYYGPDGDMGGPFSVG